MRTLLKLIASGMIVSLFVPGICSGQESSNTTLVGRWAGGLCHAVDSKNKIACTVNGGYLEVLDVLDPANPVTRGRIIVPGIVGAVAIGNGYAYVLSGVIRGNLPVLSIVDISDPAGPVEAGSLELTGSANDIKVSGTCAYVVNGGGGLRIIDISNPASPVEVGFFKGNYSPWGVAVRGNYVYAACSGSGLNIFDVTDPAQPVEAGFLYLGYSFTLALNGDVLYLPSSDKGLGIVNIADPGKPVLIGTFDMGNALGVACVNNLVYVTDYDAGLYIIRNDVQTGINNEYAPVDPDPILESNFPNPFSMVTNINYTIPVGGFVKLAVFDLAGNEVRTLVNKQLPAGKYSVTFDAGDLPEGIYIYRLRAGRSEQSRKMILLR